MSSPMTLPDTVGDGWVPSAIRLPPINQPVWAQLEDSRIIKAVRAVTDHNTWGWCNCYDSVFMNLKGEWDSSLAEYDDEYVVRYWKELPIPYEEPANET